MFTLCCQTVPHILTLVRQAFKLVLRWLQQRMRQKQAIPPPGSTTESNVSHPAGYEDLLASLRHVGDFRWILASHGPSQNPANISPRAVKESVLKSTRVAETISRLAVTEARSATDLTGEVRAMLEEMGHSYSIWYIRLLGFILIKAARRMYEHVWVNVDALRELEPLFGNRDVPG